MASSRIMVGLTRQAGVFALGAASWIAFANGLYAVAISCLLGAGALAVLGLERRPFTLGRDRPHSPPAGAFTAELSRRRLQTLLNQTPAPLLLQQEDGPVVPVNRAAREVFAASEALSLASRRQLLKEAGFLADLPSRMEWGGTSYAANLAQIVENGRTSHLAVLTDISAEVRAAEADALRNLLHVLNHELMNALTPVASMSKSALDLLVDSTPRDVEAAIRALERVVARTEKLSDFIDAYRALAQLPPPQLRQ